MPSYHSPAALNGQASSTTTIVTNGAGPAAAMSSPPPQNDPSAPAAAGPRASRSRQGSGRQIWLVTGPAGSGKSTVAQYLATQLGFSYVEGDNVGVAPSVVSPPLPPPPDSGGDGVS